MEPCKYADKIDEMHKILVGNGIPEDGLCEKISVIKERQNYVLKTLEKIEPKLDGLLSEITQVGGSLATLKADINGKETVKKDIWQKVIWIIMALAAIAGIGIGFSKIDKKISENQDFEAWQDSLRVMGIRGISPVTRSIHYNDVKDTTK